MSEKFIAMFGGFVVILILIAWGYFCPTDKNILLIINDLSLLILGGIYGTAQLTHNRIVISEKITASVIGFAIVLALIIWGKLCPSKDILVIIKDLSLLILGRIYGAVQK